MYSAISVAMENVIISPISFISDSVISDMLYMLVTLQTWL